MYDEEYGLLQANVTSPLYPRFNVYGLEPERAFKLLVYAANVKGRSGVVLLEANTLKAIEKPTLKFGKFSSFVTAFLAVVSRTKWLTTSFSLSSH